MEKESGSANTSAVGDDQAFEGRNKEKLGVGAYVKEVSLSFVSLGASAAGGALGWFGLEKPIRRLGEKQFSRADHARAITKKIWGSELDEVVGELRKAGGVVGGMFQGEKAPKTTGEVVSKILNITSLDNLKEVAKALDVEVKPVRKPAQLIGAGIGLVTATLAASFALGYRAWRKDESARLAALDLEKNINRLELFKPSDPELVAENKRLRAMANEKHERLLESSGDKKVNAKIDAASLHHEGVLSSREHQIA